MKIMVLKVIEKGEGDGFYREKIEILMGKDFLPKEEEEYNDL